MIIEHQAPHQLLTMNDRGHWRAKARNVAIWRRWAWAAAHLNGLPPKLGPSVVTIELPVRDRRRRDPMNFNATTKPIVDGLVDAGLWPDDTPEHVDVRQPVLVWRRDGVVRIRIDPRQEN